MVIAALADLCVATESATFSYPEGKVGLTGGMIAALATRIPHKLAMEIMLLGEPIGPLQAFGGAIVLCGIALAARAAPRAEPAR